MKHSARGLSVLIFLQCSASALGTTGIGVKAPSTLALQTNDSIFSAHRMNAADSSGFAEHEALVFRKGAPVMLNPLSLETQAINVIGTPFSTLQDSATNSEGATQIQTSWLWITNVDCSGTSIVVDTHAVSGLSIPSGETLAFFVDSASGGTQPVNPGNGADVTGTTLTTFNNTAVDTGISTFLASGLQFGLGTHGDAFMVDMASDLAACGSRSKRGEAPHR